MKKLFLLLVTSVFSANFSIAQQVDNPSINLNYPSNQNSKESKNNYKTWRLSQVLLSASASGSLYNNIDMDYMKAYAQNNALFDLNLNDMQEFLYQDVSAGGASLKLEFENVKSKHPQSFRLGLNYFGGKEAMITYNDASVNTETRFNNSQHYTYCVVQDEIGISADYIWKLKPNDHWFNIYAGVGTSISTSLNNELLLISNSDTEIQQAKSSQFYRAYGLFGMDMKLLPRVKLNIEGNYGYGVERISSDKSYGFKNFGLNLGLSFNLFK